MIYIIHASFHSLHITSENWTRCALDPLLTRLHSLVGRASHQYRGGGFESRWSLRCFSGLSLQLLLKVASQLRRSLSLVMCETHITRWIGYMPNSVNMQWDYQMPNVALLVIRSPLTLLTPLEAKETLSKRDWSCSSQHRLSVFSVKLSVIIIM